MNKWVNAFSLSVGCLVLLALLSPSVLAQKKSQRHGKPSARVVECKDNDTGCFIRAAHTCRKATLTMTKPLSMWNPAAPHPTHIQVSHYGIRGSREGRCMFYSRVEKSDVTYGEDYIRHVMSEEGKTRQEVEQTLSEERAAFQQVTGRSGICLFQKERLVAMLNRWWQKDGGVSISTKDFEGANCQGTLYDTTLPDRTIGLSKPPLAKPPQ